MTDAPRIEIELEDDTFLPQGDQTEVTPLFELSRLMVVGIDAGNGGKLVWRAQMTPNGQWGPGWTPISDAAYGKLAGGATTDGRVALVAQTADDRNVHFITEAATQDGGQRWAPPVDLGMPAGLAGFVRLAMARDAGGRVEIFGVDDSGGNVWWIYQNPPKIVDKTIQVVPPGQTEPITITVHEPEPPDEPWSDWMPLPGETVASLTVCNTADDRIQLFALGNDEKTRKLFTNAQKDLTTLQPDQWTGWQRLDSPAVGFGGSLPAAVLDRQGAINVFWVADLSAVAQRRQSTGDGSHWDPWSRPGMIGKPVFDVVAAIDGDNDIGLVAMDANRDVFGNLQTSAAFQQWNGWQMINVAPDFGEMRMDYNADGRLSLFLRGSGTEKIWVMSQVALNSTAWEAGWTELAAGGITHFTVVRDLTPPEPGGA